MRTAIAVLCSAAIAAACTSTAAESGNDLDGAPAVAVMEDMRIGSVDDADYGFSGVAGLDVDRDGNVYVGETVDVQIRVYAPDGLRLLWSEGNTLWALEPGEFDVPWLVRYRLTVGPP